MGFLKNRINNTPILYNNGYCEIEIEACDHNKSHILLNGDWTEKNNVQSFLQYDLEFIGASNNSNSWNIKKTIDITEYGEYRILLFGLTNAVDAQTIEVQIQDKSVGIQSTGSVDEFIRCFDYGTVWLSPGSNDLKIIGEGKTSIAIVAVKKIRRYHGNSDNEGSLKIKHIEFTNNGLLNLDTFTIEILNHSSFIDPTFSDYHKSGLVFEYLDSINIRMGENKSSINHEFGGYITVPTLSDDRLTITLSGVDRLYDLTLNEILKEITINGGTTSLTGLTYSTNSLFNAFLYIMESVELPLKSINLENILTHGIPTKYGIDIDLSSHLNEVYCTNIIKNNRVTSPVGSVLELRNEKYSNQTQTCVIFDSDNNIVSNTPIDIKNTGVFFIQYGIGNAEPESIVQNRFLDNYTSVTETVTTNGYNKDQPFLAWIEIQYSDTPTSELKTVNIDFTSKTTSNKLGAITVINENNKFNWGDFDVVSVLEVMDSQSHYYVRKITLKTQTSAQDLYSDSNTNTDTGIGYRMMFKRFGFRDGDAVINEELKASGQTQFSLLKTLADRLNLNIITIPNRERRFDTISVEVNESVLSNFIIQESKNLIDVTSLQYAPADTLKNSIIKVYTNTNSNNEAIRKVDPISIGHYGTHSDLEKLSNEPGEYNAKYQAQLQLKNTKLPNWSYTATVLGLPDARIGRLVPCVFGDSCYNEIKTIKSITCKYDSVGKKVVTELGLDDVDTKVSASINVRELRKQLLPQVEYSGGAEYEEKVNL